MDYDPINWYPEPVPIGVQTPTIYVPPSSAPYYPPASTHFYPPPATQDCLSAFVTFQQSFNDTHNTIMTEIHRFQSQLHESGRTLRQIQESCFKLRTVASHAVDGPSFAPEDPTLPSPWRGLLDGSSGLLYYWNPETNHTQYERPCEQAANYSPMTLTSSYYSAHPNPQPSTLPSPIPHQHIYTPHPEAAHQQLADSHPMVAPTYSEFPSFPPQYAMNPSIPPFQSPTVPTFVPPSQLTDLQYPPQASAPTTLLNNLNPSPVANSYPMADVYDGHTISAVIEELKKTCQSLSVTNRQPRRNGDTGRNHDTVVPPTSTPTGVALASAHELRNEIVSEPNRCDPHLLTSAVPDDFVVLVETSPASVSALKVVEASSTSDFQLPLIKDEPQFVESMKLPVTGDVDLATVRLTKRIGSYQHSELGYQPHSLSCGDIYVESAITSVTTCIGAESAVTSEPLKPEAVQEHGLSAAGVISEENKPCTDSTLVQQIPIRNELYKSAHFAPEHHSCNCNAYVAIKCSIDPTMLLDNPVVLSTPPYKSAQSIELGFHSGSSKGHMALLVDFASLCGGVYQVILVTSLKGPVQFEKSLIVYGCESSKNLCGSEWNLFEHSFVTDAMHTGFVTDAMHTGLFLRSRSLSFKTANYVSISRFTQIGTLSAEICLVKYSKLDVLNWLNNYGLQAFSYVADQIQSYGSCNFGGYHYHMNKHYFGSECFSFGDANAVYGEDSYTHVGSDAPGTLVKLSSESRLSLSLSLQGYHLIGIHGTTMTVIDLAGEICNHMLPPHISIFASDLENWSLIVLALRTIIIPQYVALLFLHILLCYSYDKKNTCKSAIATTIREYHVSLLRKWGAMDVKACCLCASHLMDSENVDETRLCMALGFASGYITTTALAFQEISYVGASLYGVADLIMLRKKTCSLESDYMDYIFGHDHDFFDALSINLHVQDSWPMMFFHVRDDTVVLNILLLRYPSNILLSRDNCVVLWTIIHMVGYVSKYMVFLARTFPISYSPFQAPVRKLFPLSSMAVVQFLHSVLAHVSTVNYRCYVGIMMPVSTIQLVSSERKAQYLEIWSGDGNFCCQMNCSLSFLEFLITWSNESGFVAIDCETLALVPHRLVSVAIQFNEALMLVLLSAIVPSLLMESVISSHLQHGPIREASGVFSTILLYCLQPNSYMDGTAQQSTNDEYVVQVFVGAISTCGCPNDKKEFKFMLPLPRVNHKANSLVLLLSLSTLEFNRASPRFFMLLVPTVHDILGDYAGSNSTIIICLAAAPCFAEHVMRVSIAVVLYTEHTTRHTSYS